jgi:Carboxypeptidase regulatory-like domain/TonB-dependent Receptor Plug Domain
MWERRWPSSPCVAVLVIAIGISAAPGVNAQIPAASVRGTVTDATRGVVPLAKVALRHTRTGAQRVTVADTAGHYHVTSLEPGEYDLTTRAAGFGDAQRRLMLRVGDNLTVDVELALEGIRAQVDVSADAASVDQTAHGVEGVVTREQIEALPLNGRSFLELARLEPGVSVEAVPNPGAFGNNHHRVSVGGSSYLQTRVTVDGSPVEDRINGGTAQNFSQESVQEFQISSFGFDLSTGLTGTGVVNILTRRGGNELHGSAFFYFRDHNLAAYPALRRSARTPDPFFARRQAGFSLGGPVKKDQLFWFANVESLNQDSAVTVANNHPVFSKLDVTQPSPLDFHLFNLRVDGRLGERHGAFLRASLDRNDTIAPPSTGTFMPSNWQEARTRATQLQAGLTSVLGRQLANDLRLSHGRLDNDVDAVTADECRDPLACVGIGAPVEVLVFDAPLLRLGHYRSVPKRMSPGVLDLVDTLTWQRGAHRVRVTGGWEHLSITSAQAVQEGPVVTLYGPTDLLATPGLRPLYDALPASLRSTDGPAPTFDEILQLPVRSVTMGVGDPSQPGPYNRDAVSHPDVLRLAVDHAWTVRPRLTLQYGLRYAYRSNIFNQDLERPAYLAPLLGGDLDPAHRGRHSLDPTLGLAWAPGAGGRTVVRLGAGVYHDDIDFFTPFLERGPLGPSGNGRVVVDGSVAGISFLSGPTAFRGVDLLPLLPGIRTTIASRLGDGSDPSVRGIEVLKQGDFIFDPSHSTPRALHAVAGVQRQLTPGLVLSVDFVLRRLDGLGGFTGAYGLDQNRFNRPRVTGTDPATGTVSFLRDPVIPLCSTDQARALDPRDQCSTGPIVVYRSGGTSLYRGLHVKLDKRMSSRLQLTASYALAGQTGFAEFLRYDDAASGYGNVSGQRRHRLTVSGVWQIPEHGGTSRLARALFNSWTLAFISQTDSAPPLNTLLVGLDLDGDGISRTLLPGTTYNSLGRGLSEAELRQLVDRYNADVEARTRRVPGANGSVTLVRPRTPFNQVINPIALPDRFASGDSFVTQDVRLTRRVAIGKSVRLDLIGEVFNLFNVANLTGYSGVLNQLGYGQPTARAGQVFGSGGPRAFQLAARVEF